MTALPRWRLEAIVAQLSPEDGALLRDVLEQPSIRRAREKRERREAFRAARPLLAPALGVTAAAGTVAIALQRYLATSWRAHQALDRLPPGVTEQVRALHRLARATGGRSLSARSILNEIAQETPTDFA